MNSNTGQCASERDAELNSHSHTFTQEADWSSTERWLCAAGQCTGCFACLDACPAKAIEKREREGFFYPYIDGDKCRQCGRCRQACPVLQPDPAAMDGFARSDCYLAWAHDDAIRLAGSSGGIFGLLARKQLEQGGAVCGAAFDAGMCLRHTLVDDLAGLPPLLRSKYVQSDMAGIHRRIRGRLEQGQSVFFCGTPCQTAALRHELGTEADGRLVLANFACHGVPSPVIFAHYLQWLEKRVGDQITDFVFRDKRYGWTAGLFAVIRFKRKGERIVSFGANFYYRCFIEYHLLRECCAACPFRKYPAGADITLADFWSIQRVFDLKSHRDRFKGYSGILAHTEAGRRLLLSLEGAIHLIPMRREALLERNSFRDHALGMRAAEFLERERADPTYSYFMKWPQIGRRRRVELLGRMLLRSWFLPVARLLGWNA